MAAPAAKAPASAPHAGAEKARLEGVKQEYKKQLTGLTPPQLRAEQKAEHARLASALQGVREAKAQLATARTEPERARGQEAVAGAERNARTHYARTALIDSLVPVKLDRAALHRYADSLKPLSLERLSVERAARTADVSRLAHGPHHGSRFEIAMAKAKVAIVDQAITRVRPADPTRNPGNAAIFDGPGMFIADASAYSAAQNAAKLKAAGIKWVTLQINNPGPVDANVAAVQAGWADAWRAAGFKVGYWGVSYGDAAKDGRTAAQLTAQLHGDFYIADCEGPFQDKEGDPARNRAFVEAFQAEASRQGIGNIPRALSSMGRVALDMKPWIDNGWDAMPQAYWNDWKVYQPSQCVQFYQDWGWPKERIHPTLATYGATGDQNEPKQLKDYVDDLKRAGTTGFSYYLPESYLDDNEYQQLVQGIASGMNGGARPASGSARAAWSGQDTFA